MDNVIQFRRDVCLGQILHCASDKDFFGVYINASEESPQHFAGPAYKWLPGFYLLLAWCFPYQYQIRSPIPFPDD